MLLLPLAEIIIPHTFRLAWVFMSIQGESFHGVVYLYRRCTTQFFSGYLKNFIKFTIILLDFVHTLKWFIFKLRIGSHLIYLLSNICFALTLCFILLMKNWNIWWNFSIIKLPWTVNAWTEQPTRAFLQTIAVKILEKLLKHQRQNAHALP